MVGEPLRSLGRGHADGRLGYGERERKEKDTTKAGEGESGRQRGRSRGGRHAHVIRAARICQSQKKEAVGSHCHSAQCLSPPCLPPRCAGAISLAARAQCHESGCRAHIVRCRVAVLVLAGPMHIMSARHTSERTSFSSSMRRAARHLPLLRPRLAPTTPPLPLLRRQPCIHFPSSPSCVIAAHAVPFPFQPPVVFPPFSLQCSRLSRCAPSSHCLIRPFSAFASPKITSKPVHCILSHQVAPRRDLDGLLMSEVWCARDTRELTRQVLLTLGARHVSLLKRLERSRRGNGCFPSAITEMETRKKSE